MDNTILYINFIPRLLLDNSIITYKDQKEIWQIIDKKKLEVIQD
jgi:hypothetical protein